MLLISTVDYELQSNNSAFVITIQRALISTWFSSNFTTLRGKYDILPRTKYTVFY